MVEPEMSTRSLVPTSIPAKRAKPSSWMLSMSSGRFWVSFSLRRSAITWECTIIATTSSCSSLNLYFESMVASKLMSAPVALTIAPAATAAVTQRLSAFLPAASTMRRAASVCGSSDADVRAQVVVSMASVSRVTTDDSESMPILRGVAGSPSAMFSSNSPMVPKYGTSTSLPSLPRPPVKLGSAIAAPDAMSIEFLSAFLPVMKPWTVSVRICGLNVSSEVVRAIVLPCYERVACLPVCDFRPNGPR